MKLEKNTLHVGLEKPVKFLHVTDTHLTYADEQDDERTCALCRNLHGKVYEIGKIPPLEHLRCRRTFRPYERIGAI